jgi:transposase
MSAFLTFAVIAALGYYLSLKIYPRVRCKRCDSSSRHSSLIYTSPRRRHLCPECGGTGRRDRLGTRLLLRGASHRPGGSRGPSR